MNPQLDKIEDKLDKLHDKLDLYHGRLIKVETTQGMIKTVLAFIIATASSILGYLIQLGYKG